MSLWVATCYHTSAPGVEICVCVGCLKLLCIHEVHVLTLTCFEFEIFGDVQFSVFLSVRYQEDQLEAGFREFYVHVGSLLTRSHWKVSLEHVPELALDSLLLARCFMFLRDPLEDRCELVQVHLGACHFVRLHESSGCCAVVCWATVTEKQQHANNCSSCLTHSSHLSEDKRVFRETLASF